MSKETVVGGNGGVLNEANKMPVQEQKSLENNEGMYYVYFLVIKVLLIFYNLLTDRHVLHTYIWIISILPKWFHRNDKSFSRESLLYEIAVNSFV